MNLERCLTDMDCGENMVCLSEFCECVQPKSKYLPETRCLMCKFIVVVIISYTIDHQIMR